MLHSVHHPSNDLIRRKMQRKRFSVSKLSSETIQTLPEYSSPPTGWSTCDPLSFSDSDRPPDYPETADETDADTEGEHQEHVTHVHNPFVLSLPRRSPTRIRRRKRDHTATSDPFLDTLLERSVHALEMSNALLCTTMSAQSSISALLSSENESDHFLEARARNLSTRIRASSGVHETWMEHLEEISEGVDKLFGEDSRGRLDEGAVSRSLPTSTMPDLRHRRKPSILDLDVGSKSHLQYSHPTRDALVAPAPRALTQYVETTADPSLIMLPSTLGLRASGSSHSVQSVALLCARHQTTQLSFTTKNTSRTELEGGTPAYHLLSNIVKRSKSLTPPSRLLHSHDRCASASPTGTGRRAKASCSLYSARSLYAPQDRNPSKSQARTLRYFPETSSTPSIPPASPHTMPTDEEPSTSSSESSDRPTGYRTVQSLRRILNDHPSSSSVNTFDRKALKLQRPPLFLPITPPPAPIQGISTATASISRLYTKGRHSMSTRPPSPPTHSSLKVHSVTPTPSPSPSTMSLSEVFGNGVARVMRSGASSRASTPKRISFAELPESYSRSQPGTSKLRERKGKKKSKQGKSNDGDELGGWLGAFMRGGLSSGGIGAGSREERMEERMARGWGWGNRPGDGTLDDWAA